MDDAFPDSHASVVNCQLTSELVDAPDFRVTIDPKPDNGLRVTSQAMADKPVAVRRERIGPKIGRLGSQDMVRLSVGVCPGTCGSEALVLRKVDADG
ncbi:MAG: type II toxin-antitoxin system PemK/MazF family toxin [Xanthobacteraceae bacterium]|nr:type II toxin-antitoxin system PemK/MazF family toxin [Xanthobacteraceae bacterium]